MKSKLKRLLVLSSICGSFSFASPAEMPVKDGEIWAGIGYLAAKKSAFAETGLAITAIGIVDAAAWGFGVGMLAGPAGGLIAGAATGM